MTYGAPHGDGHVQKEIVRRYRSAATGRVLQEEKIEARHIVTERALFAAAGGLAVILAELFFNLPLI